jgi:hypothetical protein
VGIRRGVLLLHGAGGEEKGIQMDGAFFSWAPITFWARPLFIDTAGLGLLRQGLLPLKPTRELADSAAQ